MLDAPQGPGDARGCVKLSAMPLAVIHAERVTLKSPLASDGQRGGGIQATG